MVLSILNKMPHFSYHKTSTHPSSLVHHVLSRFKIWCFPEFYNKVAILCTLTMKILVSQWALALPLRGDVPWAKNHYFRLSLEVCNFPVHKVVGNKLPGIKVAAGFYLVPYIILNFRSIHMRSCGKTSSLYYTLLYTPVSRLSLVSKIRELIRISTEEFWRCTVSLGVIFWTLSIVQHSKRIQSFGSTTLLSTGENEGRRLLSWAYLHRLSSD
jgi:hypothetical protein